MFSDQTNSSMQECILHVCYESGTSVAYFGLQAIIDYSLVAVNTSVHDK